MAESQQARRSWSIAVGLVLLISVLAAATGAIHARLYGHDIFFLLDNGWRALHGQRVHVDYSSGWGPVTFLLMAAGLAISGGSVAAVSYANAMAALALGLWAAWLAAARSSRFPAVAFPCLVALLAASPFALGEAPVWTSHGMVYNRYGFALLAIVLLECFQPPLTAERRWSEPVSTGVAIALLLFLKVTYFLVAIPIVALALVARVRMVGRVHDPSTLTGHGPVLLVLGFGATSFVFLAYLRFDVRAVVNDLAAAGAARSGSLSLRNDLTSLLAWGAIETLLLVALAISCAKFGGKEARTRLPLAALLVIAVDVMLLLSNAQAVSFPLASVFAMVLLFSLPAKPNDSPALPLAGLLVGPMLIVQSVGLVYGFFEARFHPDPPGVARFESERLHPLVLFDVEDTSIDRYANGREYVESLNDGVRLLTQNSGQTEKVATLDMFNPFAYALGREPIRGGIASAAYRYTLDDRHHPSPDRFFADAVVVMVPKYPASAEMFYEGYRKLYEPAIQKEFRLTAESARWRLYRRVAK